MADKTVASRSDAQESMASRAAPVRTLMRGTAAMRAAGETYLPKEKGESQENYAARLKRSTLFGATAKTVADMTGKVFAKPIVLKDDVPDQLKAYAEDIDLVGRHINVFAHDVFFDALQAGLSYILVDMPVRPEGLAPTQAAERAANIRPYFVHVTIENLLGFKSEMRGGVETLTQVRIREVVSEPDGEFHEKAVEQIRVLEPGKWRTFRKKANANGQADEWEQNAEGTTSLNKITLVPVYAHRTGFMAGAPPLEKLAELNIAHWQSSSDQRNILHVARIPILFGTGFQTEDKIEIGASAMIRASDVNATLQYVEAGGGAIEAGRNDLKDLEFQMQVMGLQLLVPQPGGKTATGEIRDDVRENSPLAMMADALGDALEQALGYAAEYDNLGKDKGGEVQVNKDFGIQAGAAADIPNIFNAYRNGLMSRETAWAELQRRGFLSDSFDPEAELTRIENEAPALDSQTGMNLGGN